MHFLPKVDRREFTKNALAVAISFFAGPSFGRNRRGLPAQAGGGATQVFSFNSSTFSARYLRRAASFDRRCNP